MATNKAMYPMTPEVIKVLKSCLGNNILKDEMAAIIGVSESCLSQWFDGRNPNARPRNYITMVMRFYDALVAEGWKDPAPELTMEKFGMTMEEIVKQGEQFWFNQKLREKPRSRSAGVSLVCATCGSSLSTKLVSKGNDVLVGVVPCESCAEIQLELAERANEMADAMHEVSGDMMRQASGLRRNAVDVVALAKSIIDSKAKKAEPEEQESAGEQSGGENGESETKQ
jgi:hypothetical protein